MVTRSETLKILISAMQNIDLEILICEFGRDGEKNIYKQIKDVELKNIDNELKLIIYP